MDKPKNTNNIKDIRIAKFMIWCTIFQVPVYTVLFYNSKPAFWSLLIIERVIALVLICKSVSIDSIVDNAFSEDNDNNELIKLTIFSVVCVVICYSIVFLKHRDLFMILSLCEISDIIVRKLLEDKKKDDKIKSVNR